MKFLDLFKSKFFVKGALFSAILFLVFCASILVAPAAQAGPNTPADISNDTRCAWEADSYITCGEGVEFFFNIDKSASSTFPVYQRKVNGSYQEAYIVLGETAETAVITNSLSATSGDQGTTVDVIEKQKRQYRWGGSLVNGKLDGNWRQVDDWEGGVEPDGSYPDLKEGDNLFYFMCGLETAKDEKCFDGRDGSIKGPVAAATADKITSFRENINSAIDSEDNCTEDSGALGFILCPMLKGIQSAINALVGGDGNGKGFIVELLTIKPLDRNTTPELYAGWEAVRNVALALYVLIFALIIFGNGVGYDPYTIKRALPRLAAGVILTFASFFIMQTVIDLSNLLGNVVPAFINQISGTTDFNFSFNFAYQGISIILLIILAVVALGALLVGMAGLITRVIIIYGLVLLAPLAFLAWVLPNTESLFKKWWKNLIKVAMMFPIVTGMLSLSLFFSKIMSQTASTASQNPNNSTADSVGSGVLGIAAAVAPLIAIILIPKTFKWGGEAFAAAAGYMAGKAMSAKDTGKGLASSGMKAGGKGVMASEKAQDIASNLASNKVARRLGGAALLRKAQGAKADRLGAGNKLVENMSNQQLERVAKNGNFQERVAASKALMEKGGADFVGELMQGKGGKGAASSAKYAHARYKRDAKGAGANLIEYKSDGTFDLEKTKQNIQNMSTDSMITDLGDAAMKDIVDNGKLMGHDLQMGPAGGKSLLSRQISEAQGSASLYGKATEAKQKIIGPPTFAGGTSGTAGAGSTSGATGGSGSGGTGTTRPSGGGTTPPPGPTAGGPAPGSPWGPGGLGGPGGGASPAPTTPPPAPSGGPRYYGSGSGPVPSGSTGGASPWSPPPAAPAPSLPPMPSAPTAPSSGGSIPPATPVTVSGGPTVPTPVSAPAPAAPSSSGGTTTIVNNNSVSQVFQQSGSLRTQMSGGGMEGYGDLMRKMDGIDAKLASGKVDTFALKKDLKNLRLARESAPESMHGQIDDYMRSAERAAGIPENAGAHDDVDLSEE